MRKGTTTAEELNGAVNRHRVAVIADKAANPRNGLAAATGIRGGAKAAASWKGD